MGGSREGEGEGGGGEREGGEVRSVLSNLPPQHERLRCPEAEVDVLRWRGLSNVPLLPSSRPPHPSPLSLSPSASPAHPPSHSPLLPLPHTAQLHCPVPRLLQLPLCAPAPSTADCPPMRSLSSLLLCSLVLVLVLSPFLLSPVSCVGRKKLSEKELQALEDQWFEDEAEDPDDLSRWTKGPDGQRVPPKAKAKSEMAFVSLRRPITKDLTTKWASEKADILSSGGVDVKGYAVEAGKVLFVADRGFKDMTKVQRFILRQDKVVDFEWNQKKSYPQAQKKAKEGEEDEGEDGDDEEVVGGPPDVEAILAKLQRQQGMDEAGKEAEGKKKKKKEVVDDTFLGGAGGPIPANLPED